MVVYCDSVILIYFLDMVGPFNVRAVARMATMRAAGDVAAFSDLTRLECRVKPLRLGALTVVADFDAFFTRPDVRLVPITAAVFDRATVIRATHNFKLADALHLAAAVEGGCDQFLTNDTRLAAFTDIAVEVLPRSPAGMPPLPSTLPPAKRTPPLRRLDTGSRLRHNQEGPRRVSRLSGLCRCRGPGPEGTGSRWRRVILPPENWSRRCSSVPRGRAPNSTTCSASRSAGSSTS